MCIKEFISNLDREQPIAIMRDRDVIWLGNAVQLLTSHTDDSLLSLLVRGTHLPSNLYSTYYGGASQRWNGLIIAV